MINLLELKEKSYYEYSKYELDNNEIKELREICYGYGCFLPLTEFFNDIEHNRQENYNKKQAYKDLAYLVQYIQKLEKDSTILKILEPRVHLKDSKLNNIYFSVDEFGMPTIEKDLKEVEVCFVESSGFVFKNSEEHKLLKEWLSED